MTLRSGETRTEWAIRMTKEEARAAERARCIKVLEDLRDSSQHSGAEWIAYRFAIAALSEAPTPPVASSPVGGEQ